MKSVSKLVLITASAVLSTSIAACGGTAASSPSGSGDANCKPAHTFSTLQQGKLTVSVYVSPPYTELASAGASAGGVDGKILSKIAEAECLTLAASPVDGAALINSVVSKRADLAIGGVYHTEDRAKVLNLSDPMYRDGMAILSKEGHSSLASLNGKSVGVIQGYLWNKELQDALGTDNVKVYQDSTSLLADLEAGRLEAGTLTSAEAANRAKKSTSGLKAADFEPDSKVPSSSAPGKVILAMTKGNEEMTKAFNADIEKLISDGSIAEILKAEGMSANLAGKG